MDPHLVTSIYLVDALLHLRSPCGITAILAPAGGSGSYRKSDFPGSTPERSCLHLAERPIRPYDRSQHRHFGCRPTHRYQSASMSNLTIIHSASSPSSQTSRLPHRPEGIGP